MQFGLYSSTVVDSITGGATALNVVFGWSVVINAFYLPGTLSGAFIVDYLGPKNTMVRPSSLHTASFHSPTRRSSA